jgi:hypothetical protein
MRYPHGTRLDLVKYNIVLLSLASLHNNSLVNHCWYDRRIVKVGAEVNVKIEVSGQGTVIAKFPNTTALWDVLRQAELRTPTAVTAASAAAALVQPTSSSSNDGPAVASSSSSSGPVLAKLNITEWVTIPAPEKGELFEITYHIPGYMQPIVVCGTQRIDNNDALKSTTLTQVTHNIICCI